MSHMKRLMDEHGICQAYIESQETALNTAKDQNSQVLQAIMDAGLEVGRVLDTPTMTPAKRYFALSRAFDALATTYFKATGTPLEWDFIGKEKGDSE